MRQQAAAPAAICTIALHLLEGGGNTVIPVCSTCHSIESSDDRQQTLRRRNFGRPPSKRQLSLASSWLNYCLALWPGGRWLIASNARISG